MEDTSGAALSIFDLIWLIDVGVVLGRQSVCFSSAPPSVVPLNVDSDPSSAHPSGTPARTGLGLALALAFTAFSWTELPGGPGE